MRTLVASRIVPGILMAAMVAAVAVAALLHRGEPALHVDMHDGGVWVTNRAARMLGHLNHPSRTLDGGVIAPSPAFDVDQHGDDVVLTNGERSSLQQVDTAAMMLGQTSDLPPHLRVSHGGGTTAVMDASTGQLWILPTSEAASFTARAPHVGEHPAGSLVVVTVGGSVWVVEPAGRATQWSRGQGGEWRSLDKGRIEGADALSTSALTAVGEEPVVVRGGTVMTRHATAQLPGTAWAVQPSGPDVNEVALASPEGLAHVEVRTGRVRHSDPVPRGMAAAPVSVAGCTYAAWGVSGRFLRDCPGEADDVSSAVPGLGEEAPVFRVNRDLVVLNNVANGDVFLVDDDMMLVKNWDDVIAQVAQRTQRDQQRSQSLESVRSVKRGEKNHPPQARNDALGVRPGRTTVLPVTANDSDPDGDVLTVTTSSSAPWGHLGSVRQDKALRWDVPTDASGSHTLSYTVADARGGKATATATVTVRPWGVNAAPRQVQQSRATLAAGGEISYNVLPDWLDPDGDVTLLVEASGPPSLDVRVRPDGVVWVRDLQTGTVGVRTVRVTVGDGALTATGQLTLEVKPPGNVAPQANPDHVRVLAGQQVVVSPLRNDSDANGDALRLVSVDPPPAGQQVIPRTQDGTFLYSATAVGSHYLRYGISDGTSVAQGVVRIDVEPPGKGTSPPVADGDVALLPTTGAVVVDALANDEDPAGQVLVIQSVQLPTPSPVNVEVLAHGMLRITAAAPVSEPTSFTYRVSNGFATAVGEVTVLPLRSAGGERPPTARDDVATVRAGDIVTIPVLRNDASPAGLPLSLKSAPAIDRPNAGIAFVSGDTLRFKAADDASGQVMVTHTVEDSLGNFASAVAVITIQPASERNAAPVPRPLLGRTVAGRSVRIPVTTDGIDPDGDSVVLEGLAAAPLMGSVRVVDGALEYTASAAALGTDAFSYTVRDRFGARGTAGVQVGVAPAPVVNQPPVAVPDRVRVRPERRVSVPVLANDMDADGDALSLVNNSVRPVEPDGHPAAQRERVVDMTTPDREGTLHYFYGVHDGRGGRATGLLSVDVDAEAPLRAPVARDDVLEAERVVGRSEVSVDVRRNDADPDGSVGDLTVSVEPGSGATVASDGNVTVPVTRQRQVIVYTITDGDRLPGRAVIVVPGAEPPPPRLRPDTLPIRVEAGELATIALADHVWVRDGRTPSLARRDGVSVAGGADGSPLVVDERTLQFRPAKGFVGSTTLTCEVTDARSADDEQARTAILSLPIEVASDGRQSPVASPTLIDVEAGKEATVELAALARDPDPGDNDRLAWTIRAAPEPFSARLDGNRLRVAVDAGIPAGTQKELTLSVTDGSTAAVIVQLPVRVVASTRPLLSVAEIRIDDARPGVASVVDLARHVVNPFADQQPPFTIVGEPAVTSGQGSVEVAGTVLTITPASTIGERMEVSFRLADATGAPQREVGGTVVLVLRGRPDAPTGVTARATGLDNAVVSWLPGSAHGSTISEFRVAWQGGETSCGQVSSCTVSGLTAGRTYEFTVVAINGVGQSDPSAPSPPLTMDQRPAPPTGVVATAGDGSLTVSWTPGDHKGSQVTSWCLQRQPDKDPAGECIPATGTRHTFTDVVNGQSYAVRVAGVNRAGEGEYSAWSNPAVPVGVPGRPAAPTVTSNPPGPSGLSVTVTWAAPVGNGDGAMIHEVERRGGGAVHRGAGLSAAVPVNEGVAESFRVRSKNLAGWGPWSPYSAPVTAARAPGPVGNLQVKPAGASQTVVISFTASDPSGASAADITYGWRARGRTGTLRPGTTTVSDSAFPDGVETTVTVLAMVYVDGRVIPGEPVSATVVPRGPSSGPSPTPSPTAAPVRPTPSGRPTPTPTPTASPSPSVSASPSRDPRGSFNVSKGERTILDCRGAVSYDLTCVHMDIALWGWKPDSEVQCTGREFTVGLARTFRVDGDGRLGLTDSGARDSYFDPLDEVTSPPPNVGVTCVQK